MTVTGENQSYGRNPPWEPLCLSQISYKLVRHGTPNSAVKVQWPTVWGKFIQTPAYKFSPCLIESTLCIWQLVNAVWESNLRLFLQTQKTRAAGNSGSFECYKTDYVREVIKCAGLCHMFPDRTLKAEVVSVLAHLHTRSVHYPTCDLSVHSIVNLLDGAPQGNPVTSLPGQATSAPPVQ
jgi:hypothetical protein